MNSLGRAHSAVIRWSNATFYGNLKSNISKKNSIPSIKRIILWVARFWVKWNGSLATIYWVLYDTNKKKTKIPIILHEMTQFEWFKIDQQFEWYRIYCLHVGCRSIKVFHLMFFLFELKSEYKNSAFCCPEKIIEYFWKRDFCSWPWPWPFLPPLLMLSTW